jgi:hypothetical protein
VDDGGQALVALVVGMDAVAPQQVGREIAGRLIHVGQHDLLLLVVASIVDQLFDLGVYHISVGNDAGLGSRKHREHDDGDTRDLLEELVKQRTVTGSGIGYIVVLHAIVCPGVDDHDVGLILDRTVDRRGDLVDAVP